MIELPNIDDEDDIPDLLAFETDSGPAPVSAASAIATMSLEVALNRRSRAALKRHPCLSVVRVPDENWIDIVEAAVKKMDRAPAVRTVTERRKVGGVLRRVGGEDLRWVHSGRSLMFISPDPDDLIDEAVLAAADVTISIPPLTPARLRQAIRKITGGIARGVTKEMANLDLDVILAVVRPDLSAQACIANLKRALARLPERRMAEGPILSALPLTASLRRWTNQTLADLEDVRSGRLAPHQLAYAILEGPPGTGKTLIAESLARTAGWAFLPSSVGSWFVHGDGALGGVSKNVRGFVDEVLAAEPCIGFLDELDAVPDRATLDPRNRDWWLPIITLFLTEIDRVRKAGRKVLLLGATNYYERLDAALTRPGRLQQRIPVLPPETDEDVAVLLRHFLGGDLADADLGKLITIARGATPATVEGWTKEARSLARLRDRPLALTDLIDQMIPKDERNGDDVRAIALHEVGHAIVAFRLGHQVKTVSIVQGGPFGGQTTTRLQTVVPNWQHISDMVTIALGGRAADVVLGGGANAGAEADLANATRLLRSALEHQGLGDTLAHMPEIGRRPSDIPNRIEDHLRRLLERAIAIIEADRNDALGLAERLVAERMLSGDDVARALGQRPDDHSTAYRILGTTLEFIRSLD